MDVATRANAAHSENAIQPTPLEYACAASQATTSGVEPGAGELTVDDHEWRWTTPDCEAALSAHLRLSTRVSPPRFSWEPPPTSRVLLRSISAPRAAPSGPGGPASASTSEPMHSLLGPLLEHDPTGMPSQLSGATVNSLEDLAVFSRQRKARDAVIDLGGRVLTSRACKPYGLPQLGQYLRTYGDKDSRLAAFEFLLGARGSTITNGTLLIPMGFNLVINASDVTLRGLTIRGEGDPSCWETRSTLFVEARSERVIFQDVTFARCKLEVVKSSTVQLDSCQLEDADTALAVHGVLKTSDPATRVDAVDCTFHKCVHHCVHVGGGAIVSMTRCAASESASGSGLCVSNSGSAHALGCVFQGNAEHGVRVRGFRSRVALEHCVMLHNAKRATRSGLFCSVACRQDSRALSSTWSASVNSASAFSIRKDGSSNGKLSAGGLCALDAPDQKGDDAAAARPATAWQRIYTARRTRAQA